MKNKNTRLLSILLAVALAIITEGCDQPKWKHKERKMEMRDSLKNLHPDSIIKYREARWEKKKAIIDAKFDSLKLKSDSIQNN
tara:strand:+ start:831 stop:1079 length:249 start_codon:yes stop_codon:yes gene_type:complete